MSVQNVRLKAGLFVFLLSTSSPRLWGQLREDTQTRSVLNALNPASRPEDDRGLVNGARKLSRMTLLFRRTPEQQASLEQLLADLQDPASPNYHRWLTPEEFGSRFGFTAGELDRAA